MVTTNPVDIKNDAKLFFSKLYQAKDVDFELVSQLADDISVLSPKQKLDLESPLTLQELSAALKSLNGGKSPGLDGLPAEFFKKFWDLIGPELLLVF